MDELDVRKNMLYFDTSSENETIDDPAIRPLWDDMIECEKLLNAYDSQFGRRAFCRASYAFMEGQLNSLRDLAVSRELDKWNKEKEIDIALIGALRDILIRVERTGKIKTDKARTPFINYLALVFRTLAKQSDVNPQSIFGVHEWGVFQRALKVRHRITHPKNEVDIEVSDGDIKDVRVALHWYANSMALISGFQNGLKDLMES